MRMVDIIIKKKENKELTKEEIRFFVKGFTDGTIPDYEAFHQLIFQFLFCSYH